MSKKLNESAMSSELSGSAFFRDREDTQASSTPAAETPRSQPDKPGTSTPRHRDTTTPTEAPQDALIETIRKAVKPYGKEDATYRFTAEEKKGLADIVYIYGAAGVRTSQNEITRIGMNYLLEDYRANGVNSVLARVLERLNE